ncbi:MAG: hypothetical protein JRJ84_25145 [Deltaproteobacteria bacterium]|nr:hypothetical protein [Deltaproteobacteria bacterium]
MSGALLAADPWGDPLEIDWNRAWALHCQRRGVASLGREPFRAALAVLVDRVAAVLSGEAFTPDGALRELAEALGLWSPLPPDPRRMARVTAAPTLWAMVRVATDIAPAMGVEGPDRLLGPWVEGLEPRSTKHLVVLRQAVAASCFVAVEGDRWGRAPFLQWVRRKPHPALGEREAFRAVDRAPATAWRLVEQRGGRWVLEDLVGISHRAVPDAPVSIPELASVDGGGAPGDLLVARVVATKEGWVAPLALAVRGMPDLEVIRSWVKMEGLLYNIDHKLPSLDELLRVRPHVLVRRVHEWAWVHRSAD